MERQAGVWGERLKNGKWPSGQRRQASRKGAAARLTIKRATPDDPSKTDCVA